MNININTVDQVTVIAIEGDIDGKTAPEAQEKILAQVQPERKILLDMSQVDYMSSAGLRALLSTYRQVTGQKATLVLVGLSEDIQDTMAATGFLNYFTVRDTVELGLSALQ